MTQGFQSETFLSQVRLEWVFNKTRINYIGSNTTEITKLQKEVSETIVVPPASIVPFFRMTRMLAKHMVT